MASTRTDEQQIMSNMEASNGTSPSSGQAVAVPLPESGVVLPQ